MEKLTDYQQFTQASLGCGVSAKTAGKPELCTFKGPSATGGKDDLGEPDEPDEVADVADVAEVTSPRAFVTKFYPKSGIRHSLTDRITTKGAKRGKVARVLGKEGFQ